jgi:hypothetical protein
MKRILITAGAALLVALPASVGFISNAAFAQSAPVSVPSQAIVMDDNGAQSSQVRAGEDKGGLRKHPEAGDDKGAKGAWDDGPKHS